MTRNNVLSTSVGIGVVAGLIFAIAEVVAAAATGNPAVDPLRMASSVVLGDEAVSGASLAAVVVIGVFVHLVLSGVFGFIYAGLVEGSLMPRSRGSMAAHAALGSLFGLAVWAIDFQVFARLIYPWFLDTSQLLQAMLHTFLFGLPLGLLFASVERRQMQALRAIQRRAAEERRASLERERLTR